jgi:hypothetical protein
MEHTSAHAALARFRRALYGVLGRRKDTLFELVDAALVAPGRGTLVRLSLAAPFRRRWPSAPDALAEGTLDADRLRARLARREAAVVTAGRVVWACDGTVWPRPAALTSPERTWGLRVAPGVPQTGVVPGWEYQWLVAVPEARGSWVLPLDVRRRAPGAGTPTELALAQLRDVQRARPAGAPCPVVTFDSTYDAVEIARARQDPDPARRPRIEALVRVPKRRRFYRAPPPYRGRGRRPVHGPVFKTHDPATQGPPDRSASAPDPRHGAIRVEVWERLHAQEAPQTELTLVRVTAERLPRSRRPPEPLWLVWLGAALPADLLDLWRWYALRFTVEHGVRFLKQALGWTSVRPRAPTAADRWSWLLAAALWQLWLARALVADRRLPWERPLAPERLTPGRVRRALPAVLAALGTPARPVRRRGNAPGRRPGQRPKPPVHYPVVYRRPKTAVRRGKRAA